MPLLHTRTARHAAALLALLALTALALPATGSSAYDGDSTRMKGPRAFAAASSNPAAEFAVGTPAFTTALAVANGYWNNAVACGGNVVVRWTPLEPLTNARATWHNPFDAWNNPGENFDCRVDFNSDTRYDFAMFCSVLTHELGHLLGHPHDAGEGLLMSAIYTDPLPECVNADPAAAAAAAEEAARRAAQQSQPPAPPVASSKQTARKVKSAAKRTTTKRTRNKRCFFRKRSGRKVRLCITRGRPGKRSKPARTRLSRRV